MSNVPRVTPEGMRVYHVLPEGVRVYYSKWDRPGIGFYSGSNVAGEGPGSATEDGQSEIIRRLREMTAETECVRQKIREATARRKALNDRLRALLKRLEP